MMKLSSVVEEFRELDLIFKSGTDPDVVERGYGRKLIQAISSQNEVLECEALKSLGDLYLQKAKIKDDKVTENLNRACLLYTQLLRYCQSIEEKHVVQHRIKYAEKCTKVVHCQVPTKLGAGNSSNTTLAVSMTLHEVGKKANVKGHGMTPLIEAYTNSLVTAIVDRNKYLETESLKTLGDLYLEKGRVGRDEAAFTTAASLYRAALDRCEDSDGRETLEHRIKYAEKVKVKLFLYLEQKTKKRLEMGTARKTKVGDENWPTTHEISDVIGRPNYGSMYQEQLQEGCRALQTGDLDSAEINFAAALKAVHLKDSNTYEHWKEVEPLCKLSDVYLKRGMRSKDGGDFTKAAALCNAALVRLKTESEDGEDVKQTIQKITESFVKHVLSIEQTVPIDDVEKHKLVLVECRSYVEDEIKRIEKQIDPYSIDDEHPKIREVETKRAEAIKALLNTIVYQRRKFVTSLVNECMEIMGPPTCKYAMIGLGSHATGLVTPYSDLEFAILIEKQTETNVKYFHNLTHYLHLKVINLGETILPAMAIKSLNDFESDNNLDNWFYDSVTPRGFSFDGAMPHACKTPLGRGKTCHLIRTPHDMTKVLEDDVTLHLKKGYHLVSVLGNVSLITGDQSLVDCFRAAWDQQIKKSGRKIAKLVADETLKENSLTFELQDPTARILDVKRDIYRFSSLGVTCWAQLCDIQPTSIWETIQKMHKKHAINAENAHHLMVLVSISAELRLRTYMNNHGQVENMSALSSMLANSDIEAISREVFHISNTKQLMRYYYTATPLKNFISQLDNRKSLAIVESLILFDNSSRLQADVYTSICDYRKSRKYTEEALQKELVKYGSRAIHSDIAHSLFKLGYACENLGDYQEAMSYFEQSLQMLQSIHGENTAHPDIAAAINSLGAVWYYFRDHRKAASYHKQALQMYQDIYGESTAHPNIAGSLNNLGGISDDLGDHRKALSYFEQSLQMQRSIYGENTDHPDIASSFNNLGSTWGHIGDHRKEISYHEQSLQMRLSIYGGSTAHPAISDSLYNLGVAWCNFGNYRKAARYYEQSLQIRRSVYGENTAHPDIAAALDSLGTARGKLGDQSKAVSYHKQSLQMKLSIYGESTAHPDIANSLICLGTVWSQLGNHRKAAIYYKRSFEMQRSFYGETTAHPDIAGSLNNLGSAWNDLGNHRQAVGYFEQSLQMYRRIYDENTAHPDIAGLLHNLGKAWSKLRDYWKAASYYEQSLQMRWSISGKTTPHPDIAMSLNNLGTVWHGRGDYRIALRYFEQSLKMRRSVYGESTEHPEIASSLESLGTVWTYLGDYRKAVSYYEQSLQMRQSIYSDYNVHPDIAISLMNLAEAWGELDDHRKAISYHEQSLQIKWSIYGKDTVHADIAKSLNFLGAAWNRIGDYKKAISCFEQALQMRRSIHGENTAHPQIHALLNNLGIAWRNLGDYRKSTTYSDMATRMQQMIETYKSIQQMINS
uniref:Uncharacterized protein n=1 Tax=Branchiostoma floridae TaxID=7739 RepID=C3XZ78_BRAFL|eukprot:XP_002610632.1 hypothetical protein BRAFLDRAFT_65821 [Branchiostoma floridae]